MLAANLAQKNASTSMKTGGRWLVVASPDFFFEKFCYYFLVFSHFHFAECKSLSSAFPALGKGPDKKHSANSCLPTKRCRVLYAECYIRQSSCRVFLGHCRVPLALGETTVSRSVCHVASAHLVRTLLFV